MLILALQLPLGAFVGSGKSLAPGLLLPRGLVFGPGSGVGLVLVPVLEFDLEVFEEAEGLVDVGHKIIDCYYILSRSELELGGI